MQELFKTTASKKPTNRRLQIEYSAQKKIDKQNYNQNGLDIPESYLMGMRALQQKVQQLTRNLQMEKQDNDELKKQNNQLKMKILDNQKQKLDQQTKINNILRDYNTLNEILNQNRLEAMVLKKQIQQLKKQKQNVLEKVTQKVCKQRAVSVLQNRQQQKKKSKIIHTKNKQSAEKNYNYNSKQLKTSYNQHKFQLQIDKNTIQKPHRSALHPSSIIPQNYPLNETDLSLNTNYVILLKEIMRYQKNLIQMNHQLQRYQKQLMQKGNRKEGHLVQKIQVLNQQIRRVKLNLQQARLKQRNI